MAKASSGKPARKRGPDGRFAPAVEQHDAAGRPLPARARHDSAVQRFLKNTSPVELEEALAGQDKFATFLAMLNSANYAHQSFALVMREAGISLVELQAALSDYKRQIALMQVSARFPKIVDGVATNAEPSEAVCQRCDGVGEEVARHPALPGDDAVEVYDPDTGKGVYEKRICMECAGKGKVAVPGDKSSIDTVMTLMGYGPKGNNTTIVNQPNVHIEHHDESIEALLARTQRIVDIRADEVSEGADEA